mgnify:FL=1
MNTDFIINYPTTMISAIRECGFIPFFKCGIAGWSIEEMADPEYWFTSSDQLGPWDWKISVIRESDIAYGKFLGGEAGKHSIILGASLFAPAKSQPLAYYRFISRYLSFLKKFYFQNINNHCTTNTLQLPSFSPRSTYFF